MNAKFLRMLQGCLLVAGVAGCGSSGMIGTPTAATTPVPISTSTLVPSPTATLAKKSGVIRISASSTQVGDVPTLIALDTLREQGYTVERADIARFDLVPAALAQGDFDVAATANALAWSAVAKGAPIRLFLAQVGNPYLIATTQDIKSCDDLNGKRLSLSGATGFVPAMFRQYIREDCPSATPQILVITQNRGPALLAGQIDAAQLEQGDWLQVEQQAPGRFHPLIIFDNKFPKLEVIGFHAHQDYAAKHPEILKDLTRAVLIANRRVQDPNVLRDALVRYMAMDSGLAERSAKAFLAQRVWDVNGSLTPDRIQYSLDFLTHAGSLPVGIKAEQVADLTYLNAVLKEIGRK